VFSAMNSNWDVMIHTKRRNSFLLFCDWFGYLKLKRKGLAINMDLSKDHENFFYIAELNEQGKSYDEIIDIMKKVAKLLMN